METLGLVLAAMMALSAIWIYFDASRQRDAFQVGLGPKGLAPNAWAGLAFFFFPITLPLYFKASEEAQQQSRRSGAPPVFESRGFNVYGIFGMVLFLAGCGWLLWEKEYRLAFLCLPPALMAAFGGRRVIETGRALRIDLPTSAAWEQVGFRPLKNDEDSLEDEEDDDLVVNLDRLQGPARPPATGYAPEPYSPEPYSPELRAPPAQPRPAAVLPPGSVPPPSPPPSVLRISDITWAAAEDGFDDAVEPSPAVGSAGSALPRTTVAVAHPALFEQLGGVFAPPGSATAALPVPKGAPVPPSPVPPSPPLATSPPPPSQLAAPLPSRPAPPSPAAPPAPPATPPAAREPALLPSRPVPLPIGGGAYAAARTADSRLPQVLMVGIVLLLIFAGLLFWRSRKEQAATLEPATEEAAGEEGGESNADDATDGATSEEPSAAETRQEDAEEQRLQQAKLWMSQYINDLGPVGQNLDEIDFEGFSTIRCSSLRKSIEEIELPAAPDDDVDFQLRACLVPLGYLPGDCERQSKEDWCSHLIETRRCLSSTQTEIEKLWGLPGLLEFQIVDEARSTNSMSGRCMQAEVERRSREVDPDP